jgi:hypothetical protein
LYIPSLKLALEYQGEQHYYDVRHFDLLYAHIDQYWFLFIAMC